MQKPDAEGAVPHLVFAVGGLSKGSGGIAELSRQVLKTLLCMQAEKQLQLELHVLDEVGPNPGDKLFGGEKLPNVYWYAGKRGRFALGLLLSRPDLYLFDHVGLARLQGLLPKLFARPYILLIHSVEIWKNRRSDYHRTARKARLLIANSAYTARKARNHYPDLPDIVVCWPGKDALDECNLVGERQVGSIGPSALLIVGRLDAQQRHKGHDHLIEAMPLILETVPEAQLVIAGGGSDRERLIKKAQSLNVEDHVLFLGRVNEQQLIDLYSRCALFVMPSEGDGFGLVFLEAMMHGMPCVGLEQGAAVEIFGEEGAGTLVDRENVSEMAQKLTSLLRDEQERIRLGNAGLNRYQAIFTPEHHAERFRNIITGYLPVQK